MDYKYILHLVTTVNIALILLILQKNVTCGLFQG